MVKIAVLGYGTVGSGIVEVIKISDVQIRGKANKMDIYEVLKVQEI